jgi:hypothetical protein
MVFFIIRSIPIFDGFLSHSHVHVYAGRFFEKPQVMIPERFRWAM